MRDRGDEQQLGRGLLPDDDLGHLVLRLVAQLRKTLVCGHDRVLERHPTPVAHVPIVMDRGGSRQSDDLFVSCG